ncbi:MAG: LytR/AlgR family response regulator transcription factor [Candidatus Kapaibacteriota bacterium]
MLKPTAKPLQCLIVDDEEPAHTVLANFIRRLPQLSLAGKAYSAIEALHILREQQQQQKQEPIDLVFLDVTMPEMSGIELLATLETQLEPDKQPLIILCTAHSDYALESYEYGVVDYLLKPIAFPRFAKAVQRVSAIIQRNSGVNPPKASSVLAIVSEGKEYIISADELLYAESMGNYVRIITQKERYIVQETMRSLEEQLENTGMIRIHRSYLVNTAYIQDFNGEEVIIRGVMLPVGKTFKKLVEKSILEKNDIRHQL